MAPPVPSDPIMRQPSVDLGEKQEPRRMISGVLLQNEPVQRQIRRRFAQPGVLKLNLLQAFHLLDFSPPYS
jgi:hypothetical protein